MKPKREEMLEAYIALQMALRHRDHDAIMYALDRTVQDANSVADLLATRMFLEKFAHNLTETEE